MDLNACIEFTEGYRYRLSRAEKIELEGCPECTLLVNDWPEYVGVKKAKRGYFLFMARHYSWDGATWAIDTPNFIFPSLVHDALLQLIGLKLLPADPWKLWADKFLIKMCKDRGMWWPRRTWVYLAVRWMGDPKGSKPRERLRAQ